MQALLGAEVAELFDPTAYLGPDADAARNVDLLLATQGWRRFAYRDVLRGVRGGARRRVPRAGPSASVCAAEATRASALAGSGPASGGALPLGRPSENCGSTLRTVAHVRFARRAYRGVAPEADLLRLRDELEDEENPLFGAGGDEPVAPVAEDLAEVDKPKGRLELDGGSPRGGRGVAPGVREPNDPPAAASACGGPQAPAGPRPSRLPPVRPVAGLPPPAGRPRRRR